MYTITDVPTVNIWLQIIIYVVLSVIALVSITKFSIGVKVLHEGSTNDYGFTEQQGKSLLKNGIPAVLSMLVFGYVSYTTLTTSEMNDETRLAMVKENINTYVTSVDDQIARGEYTIPELIMEFKQHPEYYGKVTELPSGDYLVHRERLSKLLSEYAYTKLERNHPLYQTYVLGMK